MKVAVVGAGFAGLVQAKTLVEFGHEVVVFELNSEVGGVWSRQRRYPGVKTQNSKQTYCLSTLPMPKSYPDHVDGGDVQKYLEQYVDQEGLRDLIRLSTEVVKAVPVPEGWSITSRHISDTETTEVFNHLCVCSGAFCKGNIPEFAGAEEFEAAGGKVLHTSDVRDMGLVKGKDVVVVGYGKSACDSAQEISQHARSTAIIARSVIWKLPTWIGTKLHYSYLLLTRFGESLFEYIDPWKSQRFFATVGRPFRTFAMSSLAFITNRQYSLDKTGLLPATTFDTIARATVSLATPGFYESILAGKIKVHKHTTISSLSDKTATLTDGSVVPCSVVVCGTGFKQTVPFLPRETQDELTDDRGNWILYRHILPITDILNLSFNGYNSSLFCPLTAEVTALWIAAYIEGTLEVPNLAERRRLAERKFAWMDERSNGRHAHGTNLVPFSLGCIDEMMVDLGVNIGFLAWMREWLLPVDPGAYKGISEQYRRKALLGKGKKVV